jgi:hypothetical protein
MSDKHGQIFQPTSYERISLELMGHISAGIYSQIHIVDDMPVAERLVRAQAKTQKRTSSTGSFGCGRNAMRSMLVWGRRIAMAALLALAVSPLHIPVPGVTAAATALAIIFIGLYWTQSEEVTLTPVRG